MCHLIWVFLDLRVIQYLFQSLCIYKASNFVVADLISGYVLLRKQWRGWDPDQPSSTSDRKQSPAKEFLTRVDLSHLVILRCSLFNHFTVVWYVRCLIKQDFLNLKILIQFQYQAFNESVAYFIIQAFTS